MVRNMPIWNFFFPDDQVRKRTILASETVKIKIRNEGQTFELKVMIHEDKVSYLKQITFNWKGKLLDCPFSIVKNNPEFTLIRLNMCSEVRRQGGVAIKSLSICTTMPANCVFCPISFLIGSKQIVTEKWKQRQRPRRPFSFCCFPFIPQPLFLKTQPPQTAPVKSYSQVSLTPLTLLHCVVFPSGKWNRPSFRWRTAAVPLFGPQMEGSWYLIAWMRSWPWLWSEQDSDNGHFSSLQPSSSSPRH